MQFEEAQALLIANKWNYAAVTNKIKEEERKENLVFQAMGTVNLDYENAKNLLQQYGWNLEKSVCAA